MHNILIIDDDRELCLLIKRSVLSEDIEADFCNTGKAGLQKLKEKQYQIVILDVMMPGMDGFETMEEMNMTMFTVFRNWIFGLKRRIYLLVPRSEWSGQVHYHENAARSCQAHQRND